MKEYLFTAKHWLAGRYISYAGRPVYNIPGLGDTEIALFLFEEFTDFLTTISAPIPLALEECRERGWLNLGGEQNKEGEITKHFVVILPKVLEEVPFSGALSELSTAEQLAGFLGETPGAVRNRLAGIRKKYDGCYVEPSRDGFARRGDAFLYRTDMVLPLLEKRRRRT